jgi:NitT/TauT family transport system ATP-binding protein
MNPMITTNAPDGSITTDIAVVRGVSKVYETTRGDAVTALEDIDLGIGAGEFVSLIGPSGCGKSTLLHILGGMRRASSGEVTISGERVEGPMPRRVGFVFQDYSLFPWRTVLENVEVGLEFRRVGKAERREIAARQLELVGLRAFHGAYPGELSGGMQQRVAIARALTMNPDILLMDEPFGALDEQTRMVLGEELSRILEETGKTIVFVTHSLAEAVFLSDRVAVMTSRPGRIKEIMHVGEPRPRDPSFMTAPLFNELRSHLYELLHDEIRTAALGELEGGAQ